jgi:hypothetical protein
MFEQTLEMAISANGDTDVGSDETRFEPERVAWWRLGLVVLATMASGAASAWAIARSDPSLIGFVGAWTGIPLVPLLFVRSRRGFRWACNATGSFLLVVGVIFFVLGLIIYVPSGLALIGAGLAERRLKRHYAVASLLISVTALAGCTVEAVRAFRPIDAYVVQFDGEGYQSHEDTLRPLSRSPSPIGRGTAEVSIGGTDEGPRWIVHFREGISPQERAALQDYLRGLPSATSVKRCEPPPWGCR